MEKRLLKGCFVLLYRYEDPRAVDGGTDGMNVLRQILQGSCFVLRDGG